jgi:hypothetical protein
MTWFADCHDVASVKDRYRELARRYHPDLGGDTGTMQAINAAYQAAIDWYTGQPLDETTPSPVSMAFLQQELAKALAGLSALEMEAVAVYQVGMRVWVIGETVPYAEELRRLGCRWDGARSVWIWRHPQDQGIDDDSGSGLLRIIR